MNPKLQHTFPSREHFAEHFVRRLSERGMELELAGQEAPPAGTVLELDLRLEDGSPLIVGTGEVTAGGSGSGTFRLRFLELTEEARAGLDELVLMAADTSHQGPAPGLDSTIRELVEGIYGDGTTTSPPAERDAVLIPPEPSEDKGSGGARAEGSTRRRSLFDRLQVSPGVIVVAVIAGATGAAANAWFHDLADLFIELRGGETELAAAPTIDQLPADVAPSDFTGEDAAPDDEPVVGEETGGAGPSTEEAGAAPILSGSVRADDEDGAEQAEVAGTPANRVRVITWDEYVAETVVTFFGNGSFPAERVLRRRVAGGRPRELIKLRGIDLPFRETMIPTETPELVRIRTGFHPQDRVNELHVVLDLTGPGVRLDRIERDESSLSIHLRSAPSQPDDAPPTAPAD